MSQSSEVIDAIIRNGKHFRGRPVLREIHALASLANQGQPAAFADAERRVKDAERMYDEAEDLLRRKSTEKR